MPAEEGEVTGTWEEVTTPESVAAEAPVTPDRAIPAAAVGGSCRGRGLLAEVAAFAGEDALAWLEGLSPEETAELRAQVAEESAQVSPAEEPATETVFGWSAFGEEPEEIASPEEAAPAAETVVLEERVAGFELEPEAVPEVEAATPEEVTADEILEELAVPEESVEAAAPETAAFELEEVPAAVEEPTAAAILEELAAPEESVEAAALEIAVPETAVFEIEEAAATAEVPAAAEILEEPAAPEEPVEAIAPEVEEPAAGELAGVGQAVAAMTAGEQAVVVTEGAGVVEEAPVAAVPETPAPRAEAEPSAVTGN